MVLAALTAEDAALTRFSGYFSVGLDEYKVVIDGVEYDAQSNIKFAGASILAEPALQQLLEPHIDTLKVRMQQASSVDDLVFELQELVSICQQGKSGGLTAPTIDSSSLLPTDYYTFLMEEIETIGWDHLVQLSDDLRSVELQTVDSSNRKHSIRLTISSPGSTRSLPQCSVDAPDTFELYSPSDMTLSRRPTYGAISFQEILSQFDAFLEKFQSFWEVMDDIDANCCVLEPQHPTRASSRRRLALAKHASVQIQILDPTQPRSRCELSFFGSDATIGGWRQRWSEGAHTWNDTMLVRSNLEDILGIRFPAPTHHKADEFAVECGICYCYRLNVDTDQSSHQNENKEETVIPDRMCENARCNRPFHEKCLFEWLKALPTARRSFSTVFGECPYCREVISAKLVT